MPIKSIKKNNIGDQVLAQMKEAILTGEWAPGSKIPSENGLAASMSVSRISIRGAIQKLSSLGLLDSRQGEGTFVCEKPGLTQLNAIAPAILLSRPDLMELLEFRLMFECECAELAATRITDDILAEMRENLELMEHQGNTPDETAFIDTEFHLLIAKATGNSVVYQVYNILKDTFISSICKMSVITGTASGVSYHNKLYKAFESKDSILAKQLMHEHLAVVHHSLSSNQPIE